MKGGRTFGALLICAALILGGCSVSSPSSSPSPAPVTFSPSPTPTPTPEPTPTPDPVAEQLALMTTEQKVSQLLIAGISGTEPGEDGVLAVSDYQVGGIIYFSRNIESVRHLAELTNDLKGLNGDHIPLFFGIDQEGGRVDRMPAEITDTPSAYQVGQAGYGYDYGVLLAETCAAVGCNVDFAPSLDVWSNPENTVIGDRAFGRDVDTVTTQGLEALSGFYSVGGVIPVAKHFPGHGDTSTDSHVELPMVSDTLDTLKEEALFPFAAAISGTQTRQRLPALMVSHILLTALDDTYPSTLSPAVVDGLLRGDMDFDGVVFTDDMTMGAITNTWTVGEACVLAVNAGCDVLLICHGSNNLTAARTTLLEAVEEGRISQSRLDESVYRILTLKYQYGLTNEPTSLPDAEAMNARIDALWSLLNG